MTSRKKTSTTPQAPHTLWPKRKIVEVIDEVVGNDPWSGRPVTIVFDILECGHKKKRGVWKRSQAEQSNSNRYCEPCFKEGKT
jgi:hypothetical protein